ncbi:MAG: hypothetical protein AB7F28_00845 [Candidatus Margulisiibacteriota bacterium]
MVDSFFSQRPSELLFNKAKDVLMDMNVSPEIIKDLASSLDSPTKHPDPPIDTGKGGTVV